MGNKIEYASYRLVKGVGEDEFIKAVEQAMGEIRVRKIPISWEFCRAGAGEFVDLIRSDDPARTEADFKALLQVPKIQKMYAMIDMATLKHTMLDLRLSYP